MRVIQTCILRLLVDPHEPADLRGTLQPLPEGEARSFVGEEALAVLLAKITSRLEEKPPGGETDEAAPG